MFSNIQNRLSKAVAQSKDAVATIQAQIKEKSSPQAQNASTLSEINKEEKINQVEGSVDDLLGTSEEVQEPVQRILDTEDGLNSSVGLLIDISMESARNSTDSGPSLTTFAKTTEMTDERTYSGTNSVHKTNNRFVK